jgi:glyoxylase-like metal-dependent hydrolase (beta-lactamase superfamily II)
LVAGDHVVLIDPGQAGAETRAALKAGLSDVGCTVDDISRVLVTHAHRDHATAAFALREEWSFRISIGAGERESVDSLLLRDPSDPICQIEMLRRAGAHEVADALPAIDPHFERDEWRRPDDYLSDGEVVQVGTRRLSTRHVPGHTRGHVVFHEPAAHLLFSGDHVLPHITPSLAFEQVPLPYPLRSFLKSLRLVLELPDAELLPAHGPTGGSSHARATQLIEHHDSRLELCMQSLSGKGESDGFTVARDLTWTRHQRRFDELDTFSQTLAVLETVAHLEVLEMREALTSRHTEGGRQVFRASALQRPA